MPPAGLSRATVAVALSLFMVGCGASQASSPPPSLDASPSTSGESSPSPSIEAAASGSPSASPVSSPPVPASARPVAVLARDTIAVVVTDGLRVRTQPRVADDSKKLDGLLPKGTRLFVAAGPVAASGFSWYRVRPLESDFPTGWVAAADHDGTPWIKHSAIGCPAKPSLAQLARIERHVALACYGSREFRFTGILMPFFAACDVWWSIEPRWLDGCNAAHVLAAGTGAGDPGYDDIPDLALRLSPAAERQAHIPKQGDDMLLRATVVGHFDDPAAASCHLSAAQAGASDLTPSTAIAVVDCRASFVVTSVTYPTHAAVMPEPALVFTGTEDYLDADNDRMTRYSFDVTNRDVYAPELFAAAPNLPPCGLNTRASRTWVHIWDATESETINGFCGLHGPADLVGIWFAVPTGSLPPDSVFVTLTDRSSGMQTQSDTLALTGP